ncbi:MAG TPA: iron-sulfur cluster assembly scaffold protein [Patescibacteria group bacterium]|nr:iron-sulfur cluster assembly scaffold protein [Patescibacteria group bacterium]
MNNTDYNPKLIAHFQNPHNVGEIKDADGVGQVGNPMCGDTMKLTIKVESRSDGNEYITDVKFKTFGCASAIATSSVVTDLAKGKTLEEALQITKQDVADEIGGLPAIKMHCSNLAADALQAAIADYRSKKG